MPDVSMREGGAGSVVREEAVAEDGSAATFAVANEDHTLGNALRVVLNQDPRTSFCGYSVPHPSEPVLHIRLQTTGAPANEVLKDALRTLSAMCEHIKQTFQAKVDEASAQKQVVHMSIR
eukprot:jgi/Chlat1/3711/Chrsp251S03866